MILKKGWINRFIFVFFIIILLIPLFVLGKKTDALRSISGEISPTTLVAHAGSGVYGFRYTNSLEALEESYNNGFQLIEIDFEWTSDGKVVAIHDWESMVARLFEIEPRVLSLKEFKTLETFQDLTLMDLDDLANWLRTKKDVFIVTDVKTDNLEFLSLVSQSYEDIQNQIIPQIYSFEEYEPAKEMGYDNIILTSYKSFANDDEIIEFVKENPVFAVTLDVNRAYSQLPRQLNDLDVFTYAHTVNDLYIFEELYENGVLGIYTDYFHADRFPIMK